MRGIPAALAVFFIGLAGPAWATGTIECSGADGSDVVVAVTTGAGPVRVPVRLDLRVGKDQWTTGGGAGRAVVVLQAFDDGTAFAIDLADPQVSEIVARLRLLRAESSTAEAEAGTLAIAGGAHALICQGP